MAAPAALLYRAAAESALASAREELANERSVAARLSRAEGALLEAQALDLAHGRADSEEAFGARWGKQLGRQGGRSCRLVLMRVPLGSPVSLPPACLAKG